MRATATRGRSLSQAIPDLRRQMMRSIQGAVSAAHKDLIDGSPVDTGLFRSSWLHAEAAGGRPENNTAPVRTKGQQIPAPTPVAPGDVDPTKNQAIINNQPYATRLCLEGYSRKVAPDWYTSIAQQWQSGQYLDRARRNA